MGRPDAAIAAAQRAVVLDPLDRSSHFLLRIVRLYSRRYEQAVQAFDGALALDPEVPYVYANRGFAYYANGSYVDARTSCEMGPEYEWNQVCLALVYQKLGRHSDAQAVLSKLQASSGDAAAFQYAEIYAQWGDAPKALDWLETALRLRDAGLEALRADPFLDPLRNEPRFQAVMRELKFPD